MNRIREALDVVDIVLGFLSSGGGRADRQLGEYITRALRMKKRFFSEKVGDDSSLHYRTLNLHIYSSCPSVLPGSRTLHTGPHPLSLGDTFCRASETADTLWPGGRLNVTTVTEYTAYTSTVLTTQDPFDTVKEEFSKELTSEGEDNQTTALDRCLRSFNLDHLLGILYEFIETHVKHCPDTERDWQ